MKVPVLKEFGPEEKDTPLSRVVEYLAHEMVQNLREIVTLFKKLSLTDNFESFEFSGIILGNTELAIRNQLRGGAVPTKRIIVRGNTYSAFIVDGDTAWDKDYVHLKNTNASAATFTVIFLK